MTRDDAIYYIAHVENALFDGHPAQRDKGDTANKSALRVAADRLGQHRHTFAGRIGTIKAPSAALKRFGLSVNWAMERVPSYDATAASKAGQIISQAADPVLAKRER